MDYKEAYEREKLKSADLAERVAQLEDQNQDLEFKLNRIKSNPVWKASAPVRKGMHFVIRQIDRVKNCGTPAGVVRKLKYKAIERKAFAHYGTLSFPDEAGRAKEREEIAALAQKHGKDAMPLISILVPLYNTPEKYLRDMIESVINQTYENWQLCLADGSDAEHGYVASVVQEYMECDKGDKGDGSLCHLGVQVTKRTVPFVTSRIVYHRLEHNTGISGNTNECLKLATGDYIGLLDHDDILHPEVLYYYVKAIVEQGADYLYCDEATFKNDNIDHMITMHFKPDYAIDNLRANNYICHFSVFKKELLDGTELFRPQFDGSQDHDMILRLTDRAQNIVHVPRLLYYWRSHAGSTAASIEAKSYAIEAARGSVADHLRRHGYEHFRITSTRAFETIFKITYEITGAPKISIVIPNCDHVEDLRRCLKSIYEKSTYTNYEIIVVENNSKTEEIESYYKELASGNMAEIVKVVRFEGDFNFSAVADFGVFNATGDYILLLNNDTQVISVNWMEELLMYAQREDVGAVGGKLYFPNRKIQHAGVVLKLGAHRTAGHSHYGQEGQNLGYMGRLCYAQDVSAVTGACLMVARKKWDEVGGFDPSFAVSLNDVDFCLKLRQKGYLNVFTPFAELYHYESKSRGLDINGANAVRYEDESEHFRTKWKEVLDAGDPYYNPNFSLDRSDFSLNIEGYSSLRNE